MNLYKHTKNQLIPYVHYWVQRPDWPRPFLTMPNQKVIDKLLILGNLYQLAKNESVLSIYSESNNLIGWGYFSLYLRTKILGSEQEHSKWYKFTLQKKIKCHWNLMVKFSLNPKSPIFGPFPQFWGQKMFFQKICLSAQPWTFLAPCQSSEKSNDPIPRKHSDRQQERRTDRLYFTRPFLLPPGVQQV